MEDVLIGQSVAEQVFMLNAQLRSATAAAMAKRSGEKRTEEFSSYSPWSSLSALLTDEPPAFHLTQNPTFERGALVTSENYLASAREFISTKGAKIIEGLPGPAEDWLPDTSASAETASLVREARRVLIGSSPVLSRLYLEFVDYVIPLARGRNRGYSSHLARGIIFRSFLPSANKYDVAIDLAHELGHQVLITWQSVDPILTSDADQPVFSEIRKVDRPAIQSFHAAVALAYMLFFVRTLHGDAQCQEAAERRGRTYRGSLGESLEMALDSLNKNCSFSPLGLKMMAEMRQLVA
jgi:HEXXH motif-containing protein